MRNWALLLTAVWLLGVWGWAGPRLEVEPEVYDFGEVAEGLLVQAVFTLTNVGDAPLVFTRQPSTSCGCTSAPLPKMRLAPGESAKLVARFDSTGYGGHLVRKYVYLYSNDPAGGRKTLTITGYVRDVAPYEGSASTLYYGFYLLVDLRSPEEYARGHLLGAINIPFSELPGWIDRLPPRFAIYLYDESGAQAAQAAQMLQDRGFAAVRAISGGLLGWWNAVGDAFFVWAEGVEPTPPSGTPYYGGYAVQPQYVARSYQLIVDLRAPEEFAAGHFPGAVNVDLHEIPAWMETLPDTGEGRLYIWCVDEGGTAACLAAQWLRAHGYPDARCLIGGLDQWRIRYGDSLLWPEGSEEE